MGGSIYLLLLEEGDVMVVVVVVVSGMHSLTSMPNLLHIM